MKDLTFIAEGNPDFFKGGLINLTKRRQVSNLFHQSPDKKKFLARRQNGSMFSLFTMFNRREFVETVTHPVEFHFEPKNEFYSL